MRIKTFGIKGFKRFKLSGIAELEIEIENLILIILGMNGAGKTSLMKQLNVLPIAPKLFTESGGKWGSVEHEGINYRFESKVHGKNAKHSLWKDGEVLCENATSTVYKDHIEKEFGITPALQELMMQSTKFSAMTSTARQDMLIKLANLNLDEAMATFNRLKARHRTVKGALQVNIERLEEHQSEMRSRQDTTKESIEKEIEGFKAEIVEYSKFILPNMKYPTLEVDPQSILSSVESLRRRSSKRAISLDGLSLNEARERVGGLTTTLKTSREVVNNLQREYEKDVAMRKRLLESQAGLEPARKALKDKEAIIAKKPKYLDLASYQESDINDIIRLLNETREWLDNIPGEPSRIIDLRELRETYNQSCAVVTELASKRNWLKTSIAEKKQLISEAVECGNCGTLVHHNHVPTPEQIKTLENDLTELESSLMLNYYDKEAIQCEINGQEMWLDGTKGYRDFIHRYSDTPIMDYLNDKGFTGDESVNTAIKKIMGLLQMAITESDKARAYTNAVESIDSLRELVASYESNTLDMPNVDRSELKIQKALASFKQNEYDLEKLTNQIEMTEKGLDTYNAISQGGKELEDYQKDMVLYALSKTAEEAVSRLNIAMSMSLQKLDVIDHLMSRIDYIEKEIATLKEEQLRLETLMETLSPRTGLIAEQMVGFLTEFLNQINSVIDSVWSYDLVVLLPESSKGELDYKFPLSIDGELSPDISEASKGQVGIVDFAFAVVLSAYNELNDYPLYLDEVGTEFDHKHRSAFIRYLNDLLNGKLCEQIIMINHFSGDYGSIANSDVLALTKGNVVLPEEYNKNVTIEGGL